jgi:predicted metallopeptidase
MKYEFAQDLQEKSDEISKLLFPHVDISRVKCFRSYGTSSRGTIARCHALGKLMQRAIGIKAVYSLEFLSERFDKLSAEEQLKTIIHELMHIPKTFGGGFKHHDHVTEKNVELHYQTYLNLKKQKEKNASWFKI